MDMKSIRRRFQIFERKNLNLSSFMNYVKTIKNQNFCRRNMRRWFNELVDIKDYDKKDKKKLFNHFYQLTKTAEEGMILDLNCLVSNQNPKSERIISLE